MEKKFKIVGNIFRFVECDCEISSGLGKLEQFTILSDYWDQEVYLHVVDKLSPPEGKCVYHSSDLNVFQNNNTQQKYFGHVEERAENAYLKINRRGKCSQIEIKKISVCDAIGPKILSMSMELEHFVAVNHGFILHSAFVEYCGKAILFTAPSGTGKTTQAILWNQYRNAKIVNGDRAAIRQIHDEFYAEGIPFSGSSDYCENRKLPLSAIVYLGQASSTSIFPLQGYRAFSKIWEGINMDIWNPKDVESISDTVKNLVEKVPVFYLQCTPDESAVKALEKALGGTC